jgi:anhydro-N-acetylmuramic acid kinase
MKVIGLMSGTSADGVDAALVEIRGRNHDLKLDLLAFRTYPYPDLFRRRLLHAMTQGSIADACHLNVALGEWLARAALALLRRARVSADDVMLIGSHGQTLHHLPELRREPGIGAIRSTLQLGDPAVIAERTGISTVADFRMRDMAAGGEGAPLTPYLHALLFRPASSARAIVNIGGISNLTYLPAAAAQKSVLAFDTGPGNMLIDGLVRQLTNQRRAFDRNGSMARQGKVHDRLLRLLLRHPFLRRRPPKSTGRETFGEPFVKELLRLGKRPGVSPADLVATATAYTARTIADAQKLLPAHVSDVIICGGGAKNLTLMRMLQAAWGNIPVRRVETLGWNGRALEAVAFAVFAYQAMRGVPCNLPSVTGARRPVVLGSITPGRTKMLQKRKLRNG